MFSHDRRALGILVILIACTSLTTTGFTFPASPSKLNQAFVKSFRRASLKLGNEGAVPDLSSTSDDGGNSDEAASKEEFFMEDLPGLGSLFGLPGMPALEIPGGQLPGPPPGMGSAMLYETEDLQAIISLHQEVVDDEAGRGIASPEAVAAAAEAAAAVAAATGAGAGAGAAGAAAAGGGGAEAEEAGAEAEGVLELVVEGLPYGTTQEEVERFFAEAGPVEVLIPRDPEGEGKGLAVARFAGEAALRRGLLLDRRELGGRWLRVERAAVPYAAAATLKVRGFPYGLFPDDLRDLFAPCGAVADVRVPIIKYGRPAIAYVVFEDRAGAEAALAALDGAAVGGRRLEVFPHCKALPPAPADRAAADALRTSARDDARCHVRGLDFKLREADLRAFFEGRGLEISNILMPKFKDTEYNRGFAYVTFASPGQADQALACRGADLQGFRLRIDKNPIANVRNADSNKRVPVQERDENAFEKLDKEGLVYMGNIPYTATQADLTSWFQDKGVTGVNDCVIPQFRGYSGRNRGIAYIGFQTEEMKSKALSLDGENMQGRWLKIQTLKKKKSRTSPPAVEEDLYQ